MANVDEVSKLKVDQLKELAAQHNVELADGDKKDDLVLKVADGVTPEQLEAYNNKDNDESNDSAEDENSSDDNSQSDEGGVTPPEGTGVTPVVDGEEETPAEQAAEDIEKSGVQGLKEGESEVDGDDPKTPDAQSDGANDEDQTVPAQADGVDGVERDHTPAGTTEEANAGNAGERVQPPVAANPLSSEASDEAYDANNSTVPGETPAESKDRENEENAEKVETRLDEAKQVETELGTSEEEAAAARNGVRPENLDNPKQNREPKNEFEQSNQKVTEEERQAAQKVSDMTTAAREDEAPTPSEAAHADAERSAATNQGSEIADAISQGLRSTSKDNFELQPEVGIEPRMSVVRSKQTGEVLLRDNGDGHLSKIQLESLEEKEASIQGQDVEEV